MINVARVAAEFDCRMDNFLFRSAKIGSWHFRHAAFWLIAVGTTEDSWGSCSRGRWLLGIRPRRYGEHGRY